MDNIPNINSIENNNINSEGPKNTILNIFGILNSKNLNKSNIENKKRNRYILPKYNTGIHDPLNIQHMVSNKYSYEYLDVYKNINSLNRLYNNTGLEDIKDNSNTIYKESIVPKIPKSNTLSSIPNDFRNTKPTNLQNIMPLYRLYNNNSINNNSSSNNNLNHDTTIYTLLNNLNINNKLQSSLQYTENYNLSQSNDILLSLSESLQNDEDIYNININIYRIIILYMIYTTLIKIYNQNVLIDNMIKIITNTKVLNIHLNPQYDINIQSNIENLFIGRLPIDIIIKLSYNSAQQAIKGDDLNIIYIYTIQLIKKYIKEEIVKYPYEVLDNTCSMNTIQKIISCRDLSCNKLFFQEQFIRHCIIIYSIYRYPNIFLSFIEYDIFNTITIIDCIDTLSSIHIRLYDIQIVNKSIMNQQDYKYFLLFCDILPILSITLCAIITNNYNIIKNLTQNFLKPCTSLINDTKEISSIQSIYTSDKIHYKDDIYMNQNINLDELLKKHNYSFNGNTNIDELLKKDNYSFNSNTNIDELIKKENYNYDNNFNLDKLPIYNTNIQDTIIDDKMILSDTKEKLNNTIAPKNKVNTIILSDEDSISMNDTIFQNIQRRQLYNKTISNTIQESPINLLYNNLNENTTVSTTTDTTTNTTTATITTNNTNNYYRMFNKNLIKNYSSISPSNEYSNSNESNIDNLYFNNTISDSTQYDESKYMISNTIINNSTDVIHDTEKPIDTTHDTEKTIDSIYDTEKSIDLSKNILLIDKAIQDQACMWIRKRSCPGIVCCEKPRHRNSPVCKRHYQHWLKEGLLTEEQMRNTALTITVSKAFRCNRNTGKNPNCAAISYMYNKRHLPIVGKQKVHCGLFTIPIDTLPEVL